MIISKDFSDVEGVGVYDYAAGLPNNLHWLASTPPCTAFKFLTLLHLLPLIKVHSYTFHLGVLDV